MISHLFEMLQACLLDRPCSISYLEQDKIYSSILNSLLTNHTSNTLWYTVEFFLHTSILGLNRFIKFNALVCWGHKLDV